jgi:hypothetical protein
MYYSINRSVAFPHRYNLVRIFRKWAEGTIHIPILGKYLIMGNKEMKTIKGNEKFLEGKTSQTCLRHYLSKKLSQTLTPNRSN